MGIDPRRPRLQTDPSQDRRQQIDALLLKLPGVEARKISGLHGYFVQDKMFACLADGAVGLRLPAAMATELQFSNGEYIGPFSPGGMVSTREWVQIKRENAAEYVKDMDLFEASVEFVKKGRR
jgi:hypothetical protein